MAEQETKKKPSKKRQKLVDFAEFRGWLTGLDMHDPILHVNGAAHPTVALTVDFGTPLIEQKLTSEQTAELITRMRAATKSLFTDKEVSVRVQNDTSNGIWWGGIG